jgi:hypothetical protein
MFINPKTITAITTSDYHNDIMGMEILYTTPNTTTNQIKHRHEIGNTVKEKQQLLEEPSKTEKYNDDTSSAIEPPIAADCILIAHGARVVTPNDDEFGSSYADSLLSYKTIPFWSIHIIFDKMIDEIGFYIHVKMAEALDICSRIVPLVVELYRHHPCNILFL